MNGSATFVHLKFKSAMSDHCEDIINAIDCLKRVSLCNLYYRLTLGAWYKYFSSHIEVMLNIVSDFLLPVMGIPSIRGLGNVWCYVGRVTCYGKGIQCRELGQGCECSVQV